MKINFVFVVAFLLIQACPCQAQQSRYLDSILTQPFVNFVVDQVVIEDTLAVLSTLLSYKDSSGFNFEFYGYTRQSSREFMADRITKDPTREAVARSIAALYLFTAIVTQDREFCSNIEVIKQDGTVITGVKKTVTRKGQRKIKYRLTNKSEIAQLFILHERWLSLAHRVGIKELLSHGSLPLTDSEFAWP